MSRRVSKNPQLQQRLQDLEKELAAVDGDIRRLSKAVRNPDSAAALKQLSEMQNRPPRSGGSPAADAGRPPGSPAVKPPGWAPPPGELFRSAAPSSRQEIAEAVTPVRPGPATVPARPGATEQEETRRFANYFTSGSFHSVQPLRQEKRIQRNRAILMVVIALVALILLIRLFF